MHHVAKQLVLLLLHCRSAVNCCPVEGQHWIKWTYKQTNMSIYAQCMCLWMAVVSSTCVSNHSNMFALAFGSNFDFVFVNTLAFELKSNGQTSKKTSQTQETQIGTAAFYWLQYFFKWWWWMGGYCRSISSCFGSCSWRGNYGSNAWNPS